MCEIEKTPFVSIVCNTYNHVNFIRQCLDGFIMQQTSFPFEILVHDDASTDGTAEIVREYERNYPDLIKPIYQKENQYSKGVKVSLTYQYSRAKGKYIALCEGDDYWTDPLKLQKQVDFLEQNAGYTMICSDAVIQTNKGELNWCRYNEDKDVPIEDIIINGGLFIQTASLLYHKKLLNNYPECCIQCKVGDYPLTIYASLTGKVRWIAEKQVVYRFAVGNSWTVKDLNSILDDNKILERRSIITMLQGLDAYSNYEYHNAFRRRMVLYRFLLLKRYPNKYKLIHRSFKDIRSLYTFREYIREIFIVLGIDKYYDRLRSIFQ